MKPNYAIKLKEEIDKLLRVDFIGLVKQVTLLNLILVVPIKNGNIRVCVDYRKLNATTITDEVLDAVVGHKIYSFLYGFNKYSQISMHPDDQEKTTIVTEW